MRYVELEAFIRDIEAELKEEYETHNSWHDKGFRKGLESAAIRIKRVYLRYRAQTVDTDCIEPKPVKPAQPEKPPECLHKYRDYAPYLIYRANAGTGILSYKIVEPYLCLKCKERTDVCLEEGERFFSNIEEYKAILVALKEQYPFLRDRALVEDEINDDMLVDREYLRAVDVLQGKVAADRSIKLVLNQAREEAMEGGA
jgi:hypothetical protein